MFSSSARTSVGDVHCGDQLEQLPTLELGVEAQLFGGGGGIELLDVERREPCVDRRKQIPGPHDVLKRGAHELDAVTRLERVGVRCTHEQIGDELGSAGHETGCKPTRR